MTRSIEPEQEKVTINHTPVSFMSKINNNCFSYIYINQLSVTHKGTRTSMNSTQTLLKKNYYLGCCL